MLLFLWLSQTLLFLWLSHIWLVYLLSHWSLSLTSSRTQVLVLVIEKKPVLNVYFYFYFLYKKYEWVCKQYFCRTPCLLSGAEPHSGLGGPWPLQKKKNFPLGYEEKINWPPNIRQLAPLPISHLFSRPQSKIKNTLKLK